jgi:hypothetical protein
MSETEIILKNESGVKAYEGEHPPSFGLKAGAFADVGTIILTNQRFVYINKGGAARSAMYALGGALAARASEKRISKAELDDVVNCSGSYSIPIQNITRVDTARHFGSSYLRIDNNCSNIKPSHSFILGSGISKNEDWVAAINSAISNLRSPPPQNVSVPPINPLPTNNPPSPPPTLSNSIISPEPSKQIQPNSASTLNCPSCGISLDSSAKFCSSCGVYIDPAKSLNPSKPKKFCENCGVQIGSSARFCGSCGSKVNE